MQDMHLRHLLPLLATLLLSVTATAQEVLTPLYLGPAATAAKPTKTSIALPLPFFDDFSYGSSMPSPDRWIAIGARVDNQFAAHPPTVGMLTLDAIDDLGRLYNTTTSTLPFPADTIMSMPLRLDSLLMPTARRLTVADSLALSFYYLPGGGSGDMWMRSGDSPDQGDSLVLEFYDATTHSWHHVWSTDGTTVDDLLRQTGHTWQYVYIPIDDPRYLTDGFRFRLRNYCSYDNTLEPGLVGNCDQWHIDYIMLDHNRHRLYTYARDVAFVDAAPSMLRNYQAMPARQFRTSEMADNIDLTITNRYEETLSTYYHYYEADNYLPPYDGGIDNIAPYAPEGIYQTAPAHAHPPVSGSYPTDGVQRTYHIIHVVTEGVSGDAYPSNDTLHYYQHLENYYAYDDGSAENGYGIYNLTGNTDIALHLNLNQADTLTAIALYFNRTRASENAGMEFRLCVWDDDNGQPGNLIYIDNASRQPLFTAINRYYILRLDHPLRVSGTIYIGLRQTTPGIINLGMDRNTDASEHLYYRIGNTWQRSFLAGSLMMRPYFGTINLPNMGAIDTTTPPTAPLIYPNPASHTLHIDGTPHATTKTIYTLSGQPLISTTANSIAVGTLASGIYLLQLATPDSPASWHTIVIQH